MIEYDPNWPFPQFDESGHRLLPPDWGKRQPKPNPTEGVEDAPF
jgi:hypothetical protein